MYHHDIHVRLVKAVRMLTEELARKKSTQCALRLCCSQSIRSYALLSQCQIATLVNI